MPNKNYYDILGVSKSASQDDIKSAYRKLAKLYHPDLHPNDPECAQKFKEINEAYEVLGDSNKRSNYDQFGSANGNPNDFFGGGAGGGFGGRFNSGSFSGFEDIFDIFSSFGGGQRRSEVQVAGEDISVNVNLSFKEAVFGCEKIIKVTKLEKCSSCSGTGAKDGKEYSTCPDCHGSGQARYTQNTIFGQMVNVGPCKTCNATGKIIKSKCPDCNGKGNIKNQQEIKVKIPAGIDNEQVIRLNGEGHQTASNNGIPGDLRINIKVTPHSLLVRKGFDLYVDVYVPITTLLLGGKVAVPTLKGATNIDVAPLTQSNTKYTLKGKGVKYLKGFGSGDIIVTLKGEMPKDIDKNTIKIIKDLEKSINEKAYPKTNNYNKKLDD